MILRMPLCLQQNCTRLEKPKGEEDLRTTRLTKISLYPPPQPYTGHIC